MGLTVGSWICYLLGTMLHAGLQLKAIKTAHKQTWAGTFSAVWLNLGCRVFIATMIVMALGQNPDLIYKLLTAIGFSEPANTSLHLSAPMAGIFGYAFDNILAFIPFLKSQVPELESPAAP